MRAELEDWYRFIRAHSHVLHRPQRLFQLAINEPDSSPIAKRAAQRVQNKRETRPWLRWINKPQQRNPCLVTLTGGGRKSGFAFSPDSTRIVTGWNDESMRVWNAQTGQLLVQFPCLTTPKYERDLTVMGCAFVDGGKKIATYVEDDSIKLWNAETGEEVACLARHGEGAKSWCASRDGRRVAASFWDNKIVKIWDTATGELRTTLRSDSEAFFNLMAFSHENLFLACGMAGTVAIWTQEVGVPVSQLSLGIVDSLEFSPDEELLLTVNNIARAAHVWHFFTGDSLASFEGHTDRIVVSHFSPDGSRVVTASWDKTLKLWTKEGQELQTFAGHTEYVTDCQFSPDGRAVVSASKDMTLKVWDCENGDCLATLVGHSNGVAACAFSPDGQLIVSTSNESTRIWDASARTGAVDPPSRRRTCALSVDGTKAVVDEKLVVDVANGNRLDDWDHSSPSFDLKTSSYVDVSESDPTTNQIRFTADREYVIGVVDQKLKVLDADDNAEVMIISNKAPATFCVSPDGKKIVCAILEDFFDQSIKCFDTLTGSERFSMKMPRPYGDRTPLRFTFDGQNIMILTPAGSLFLIDADSGDIVSEFLHHEEVVTFDTSPTGNVVIAGGKLGSVFVLRLENFN